MPALGAVPASPPDDAPHLLVVDDDARIRNLLSRFLTAEGYRVSTADNAAEARARLSGLHFDLLILDVMMPGESGFDLTRSLRQTMAVPILMLTARAEPERLMPDDRDPSAPTDSSLALTRAETSGDVRATSQPRFLADALT